VFGDATLSSLEERALRDNPGAKAAAQRLLQAQAQLGVLRAGQAPNLSVNAGVSNSRTSAETSQALALGGRSIEGNNFSVGAALSYELDMWGRVRRVVEAADAQALAAQDDRDGVLLLLSSQVAQSYWQLRGLDAEQAILRERAGGPARGAGTGRGALRRRPDQRTGCLARPRRARECRSRPA
jgi:multidrug efflux system outer membrane protein